MFSRSTEQAESINSPSGHAGAEGAAPPRRDPGQRRFDIGIVALTLGLAVVIVAGLVAYGDVHDANQAKARARAAATAKAATEAAQVDTVKQAYLAYWTALGQAYSQLSVAPLQPYTTPAGAQQEVKTMQPFIRSGYRYTVTADHDLKIVVYSGGQLASIDDNLLQQSTPLDATTMQPAGRVKTEAIHSSFALQFKAGHWLVDSLVSFGGDGSEPSNGLSYAAASRGKALDPGVELQIQQAYLAYWDARRRAYQALDQAPLEQTILQPALGDDLAYMAKERQKNQGFSIRTEHNDRIGLKDAGTAYVYDTRADFSFHFDVATKAPLPHGPTDVLRETYELVKVAGTWRVKLGAINK